MNRRAFLTVMASSALLGSSAAASPTAHVRSGDPAAFAEAARRAQRAAEVALQHAYVTGTALHPAAQVRAVLQGVPAVVAAADPVCVGLIASLAERVCASAAAACEETPALRSFAEACTAVVHAAVGLRTSA